MENETKACKKYSSVEQGVLIDNSVLLTICGDSAESQESVLPNNNRSDLRNVLSYRFIDKQNERDGTKGESNFSHRIPIPMQLKSNCEFFLVKEFSTGNQAQVETGSQPIPRNVPRRLAPKFSGMNCVNSPKRNFVIEAYKKRDDKKRATHNEVERRRRDKINSWIFKLKELIPQSEEITLHTDKMYKVNTTDSKSKILIRACEYIKEMQEELKSLRKCLMENDSLQCSDQQLQIEKDQHTTLSSQSTCQNVPKFEEATDDRNN